MLTNLAASQRTGGKCNPKAAFFNRRVSKEGENRWLRPIKEGFLIDGDRHAAKRPSHGFAGSSLKGTIRSISEAFDNQGGGLAAGQGH